MTDRSVAIVLLADHLSLIPAVGELRWREWGRPPEPEKLEWWVDVTGREAGRDHLPVTWVALGARGQMLGAVGLGQYDIEERRDRSPWVLGMIVEPLHRSHGIGGQLMASLEAWAHLHGYPRAWVATSGRAVGFYQKCGWELIDFVERSPVDRMSILTKSL